MAVEVAHHDRHGEAGEKDPVVISHVFWMWLRGQEDLVEVVGAMRPPEAGPLAVSGFDVAVARGDRERAQRLADLLGDLHAEATRPRLQAAVNKTDAWLRIYTLVTLCRLGDKDAGAALLRELDGFPIDWLPDLVNAFHDLREPDARARVTTELERRQAGREATTALAAAAVRLPWTPDAAWPRLVAGLMSTDVIELRRHTGARIETAERYLRHDRTPRVDLLLAGWQSKERNPEVKGRLGKLIDVRGGE